MSLNIITGCMFSGKTSSLIKIIDNILTNPNNTLLLINSSLDTRTDDYIKTHDNKLYPAIKKNNIDFTNNELIFIKENYKYILIDEAQFFPNLVYNIQRMLEHNINIYVAGLDADSNQQKFGEIIDLIPFCDSFTKLKGTCYICNNEGAYTKRINKYYNNQVLIGAENYYKCVCRKHL